MQRVAWKASDSLSEPVYRVLASQEKAKAAVACGCVLDVILVTYMSG